MSHPSRRSAASNTDKSRSIDCTAEKIPIPTLSKRDQRSTPVAANPNHPQLATRPESTPTVRHSPPNLHQIPSPLTPVTDRTQPRSESTTASVSLNTPLSRSGQSNRSSPLNKHLEEYLSIPSTSRTQIRRSRTAEKFINSSLDDLDPSMRAAVSELYKDGLFDFLVAKIREESKSGPNKTPSHKSQSCHPTPPIEPLKPVPTPTLSATTIPISSENLTPDSTPPLTTSVDSSTTPNVTRIQASLLSHQSLPIPPAPPLNSILLVQQRIMDLILKGREMTVKTEHLILKGSIGVNTPTQVTARGSIPYGIQPNTSD